MHLCVCGVVESSLHANSPQEINISRLSQCNDSHNRFSCASSTVYQAGSRGFFMMVITTTTAQGEGASMKSQIYSVVHLCFIRHTSHASNGPRFQLVTLQQSISAEDLTALLSTATHHRHMTKSIPDTLLHCKNFKFRILGIIG